MAFYKAYHKIKLYTVLIILDSNKKDRLTSTLFIFGLIKKNFKLKIKI